MDKARFGKTAAPLFNAARLADGASARTPGAGVLPSATAMPSFANVLEMVCAGFISAYFFFSSTTSASITPSSFFFSSDWGASPWGCAPGAAPGAPLAWAAAAAAA